MTNPGLNATDPTTDSEAARIATMDESLPYPPDHEDLVEDSDQPEPEQTEVPDAIFD